MKTLVAFFNSNRMLEDYVNRFYLPSSLVWDQIKEDQWKKLRSFNAWKNNIKANWHLIKILEKRVETRSIIKKGKSLKIEILVSLGSISPEDISVEIYHGPVDSKANFLDRFILPLKHFFPSGEHVIFKGEIPCDKVGRFGFKIRIIPFHPLLKNPYSLGLILWG